MVEPSLIRAPLFHAQPYHDLPTEPDQPCAAQSRMRVSVAPVWVTDGKAQNAVEPLPFPPWRALPAQTQAGPRRDPSDLASSTTAVQERSSGVSGLHVSPLPHRNWLGRAACGRRRPACGVGNPIWTSRLCTSKYGATCLTDCLRSTVIRAHGGATNAVTDHVDSPSRPLGVAGATLRGNTSCTESSLDWVDQRPSIV